MFYLIVLYIWAYFSIFCHEFGHSIIAKILGFNPYFLEIGTGRKIFQLKLSNSVIEFRVIPSSGKTYISNLVLESIKPKLILFYLAGPMANCFLSFMFSTIYTYSIFNNISGLEIFKYLADLEFFIMFVGNLIPIKRSENNRRFTSDGMKIIEALTKTKLQFIKSCLGLGRYISNQESLTKNNLFNNLDVLHILFKAQIQLNTRNFDNAIELLEPLLNHPALVHREKIYIIALLCSIIINHGEIKYLEHADKWSSEALRLASDIKTIQGTRGAILIELGRYSEGKELLLPLTEVGNDATDIAVSCCYIAKADYLLGNEDKVKYWLKNAQRAGSSKEILLKIQKEINCFI